MSILFLFTSVQSPYLSALPHVYHEYTTHASVQVVNSEGEVVELSKDLVRHAVTFLSDVDLMSAFTATAKQVQWQSMMPAELWDQTPF